MKRSIVWLPGLALVAQIATAQTPTAADVGDADSFGHAVIYLGYRQSTPVNLSLSCAGSDPAEGRCIPIVPNGGTTAFNESELGIIRLPARATRTLICQAVTVSYFHQNFNPGTATALANFTENAVFTIESPVLNDPTLINRVTGLPFNGKLVVGTSNIDEEHPLASLDTEDEQVSNTKLCGEGLVSRQRLIQLFGLTPALATQFFQRPITIHLGAVGQTRLSISAQFFYVLRLFGDQ